MSRSVFNEHVTRADATSRSCGNVDRANIAVQLAIAEALMSHAEALAALADSLRRMSAPSQAGR